MKSLRIRFCLCAALSIAAAQPAVAGLDLKLVGLKKRDTNVPPIINDPNIELVGIVGKRAGFTFSVLTENVGDKFIPWGFPMFERRDDANLNDPTKTTPWVKDNAGQVIYPPVNGAGMPTVASPNGFSGVTEGLDTPHTLTMPNPAPGPRLQDDPTAKNYVGSHPHLQLSLWVQPGGNGAWQEIGCSDLKHAFSTVYPRAVNPTNGGDDYPAFSGPGEIDDYGNDSDRDRDFYGPMSEMNPTTFEVPDHLHLAGDDPANFRGVDANGYRVYERAHGQKEHKGAGHEIEHLLQADVLSLLVNDGTEKFNGMNGLYDVNTKWYAAGTWYVIGDTNNNNNTSYRQFKPGWNNALQKFEPNWMGVSFDGSMNNAPAMFLLPNMAGAACPEPGSLALLVLGGLALLHHRKPKKNRS